MTPDTHEIYERRRSRNRGLGITLIAFVLLVFGVTLAKLHDGQTMQAFDHTFRPAMLPAVE